MKSFLKKHQEGFLLVVTILLLAILAGFYIWTIYRVADSFNTALNEGQKINPNIKFSIEGARKLNITPSP